MNQHERFADDRFSEGDSDDRPVALPTRNPPAGDPVTDPKRGDDILPGQPEVAGAGYDDSGNPSANADNGNSDEGGSEMNDRADHSRNDGNTRSA